MLGGVSDKFRETALMLVFRGNSVNIDFNSRGFKLLWEKEKNINVTELKK